MTTSCATDVSPTEMQGCIFLFLFYLSQISKTQQMAILFMQIYKFYSIPIKKLTIVTFHSTIYKGN